MENENLMSLEEFEIWFHKKGHKTTLHPFSDKNSNPLEILSFYPYSNKKKFTYWLTGTINLSHAYLKDHLKNKSEIELVNDIKNEITRAFDWFEHNKKLHGKSEFNKAFAYQYEALNKINNILFEPHFTNIDKNKFNTLTKQQKYKIIKKSNDNWNKVYAQGDFVEFDQYQLKSITSGEKVIIDRFPIISSVNGNILYTKQQLASIHLLVECCFENLC